MSSTTTLLTGRRLLVVEDEFYLAEDLARDLAARGAVVIGPVPSVDDALDLVEDTEHIDGAVLDLNLQGEPAPAPSPRISSSTHGTKPSHSF